MPGLLTNRHQHASGVIDPELAFEAAVSLALGAGLISRSGEADREASRFTDTSYVLMGTNGGAVQRIARSEIVAELERLARINSNLEQYHLRFRPGRVTVMVALFAGFTTLLSAQGWMNMINDRRIAALEASYLEHQASLSGSGTQSELAAIETVDEFHNRVLKAKLDGCYAEVKSNLAKAAGSLQVAMSKRSAGLTATDPVAQASLRRADGAYQQYKASRESCKNSLFGLMGWGAPI